MHIYGGFYFTGTPVNNSELFGEYWGGESRVIARAAMRFLGRGKCDVCADFICGDSFDVCVVALSGSGYDSLQD